MNTLEETTVKRQYVSDIAFTPAVKAEQERRGSRESYARMEQRGGWHDWIDDGLRAFIAERDSFYLGTANSEGQPYIQHRGGPAGFLRVIDDKTLAFADLAGNKQYITTATLSENDKAFLFLMDYPNRRRVKIWGRARVVEDDPELLSRLTDRDYKGRPERAIVFEVEAWAAGLSVDRVAALAQRLDVLPDLRAGYPEVGRESLS